MMGLRTIAERRAGLRSDFLNDLVQARDQGDKLTDEELFGMIFGLFGALAATSRSAGGAFYTIYRDTDQLAESLRAQVSELAVAGAEKILKREVDARAHADLLSALEKQL